MGFSIDTPSLRAQTLKKKVLAAPAPAKSAATDGGTENHLNLKSVLDSH
jgi:hypothetical protein